MSATSSHHGEFARGVALFDRYVIDRCVRRDRLASVYVARDRSGLWASVWAARRDQISRTAESADRFAVEVGRLSTLSHPSLPSLLAWDIELDTAVIASTYKPGRSLREVIAADAFVAADDVARIVTAVASALQALHTARLPLVHLGVCPERVQIGEDGRVWLEEAGFLRALLGAGLVSPPQVASFAQPGYALPTELVHSFDPLADVFQLAVLAFEALTGQLPFGAAQPSELTAVLHGDSLPTASTLRPGLSAEVDELFLGAWRTAIGTNPQTAENFARELARTLAEDRNRRPTFPGSLPYSTSRRPMPLAPRATPPPPERTPVASALDTVDRAFDEMIQTDTPRRPSNPPVIEFTPLDASAEAMRNVLVDVAPVKPTLVGAGVKPASQPPTSDTGAPSRPVVQDQETPAAGYERLKLIEQTKTDATASASPDATSRIDEEVLDALRRTTQARAGEVAGAKRDDHAAVSRAPFRLPRPNADVPPPPESGTRPTASPLPPARRRRTSKPPKSTAPEGEATHTRDGAVHTAIPKPPKLPEEAQTFVVRASTPAPTGATAAPSIGPQVSLHEPSVADEVSATELQTQDILEGDLPSGLKQMLPPQSVPEIDGDLVETAPVETTRLAGTPLPPASSGGGREPSLRPPPIPPEAQHEAHPREETHDPPPVPPEAVLHERPPTPRSQRPPPPEIASAQVGTSLKAPPPPNLPERNTRPPGERSSVTALARASTTPHAPVDGGWVVAARWLSVSTVVSALLVTAGFVYMRGAQELLIDELRRTREDGERSRVEASDASAPGDAWVASSDAAVQAEDAAPSIDASRGAEDVTSADVLPLDDVAPDRAPAADRPTAVATADAAAVSAPANVTGPDAATRVRLSGAMRGAISDCVEGVEDPRWVIVNVRYDGPTGTPTRIRLHGVFQEPPMGPCIEHAVREVRAPAVATPGWETEYRFPVPPPRWRQPPH